MEAQTILEQLKTLTEEQRQFVETVIKSLAQKVEEEPAARERVKRFGALKGMVSYMSPDFDEPLEDFKDYM